MKYTPGDIVTYIGSSNMFEYEYQYKVMASRDLGIWYYQLSGSTVWVPEYSLTQ